MRCLGLTLLFLVGFASVEAAMVEPIYDYHINIELLESLRCPRCREPLHRVEALDPFVQGLVCTQGHRFFVTLRTVLDRPDTIRCDALRGATATSGEDTGLIKIWLTDLGLRSCLNNQLATMLRRIHEIYTSNLHIAYDESAGDRGIFKYCPICGTGLELFPHFDAWVEALRCANGHEGFLRQGALRVVVGEQTINLNMEMSNQSVNWLVDSWLQHPPGHGQLHPQIRDVLARYQANEERSSPRN